MKKDKDILTVAEVLASLDNSSKRVEVFNRLRTSTSLTDELEGIKDFLEANDYDPEKLKAFVNKSEKSFDAILEKSSQSNSNNTWLKVAAVIIPLVGLAAFFLLNKTDVDLYAKYHQKEVGLPVFMDVDNHKAFNEAMNAYKDNDFKEARIGFEGLLQQQSENDTLLYFVACSNEGLGAFEQAIDQFNSVATTSVFREKSEFRKALCLLKLEQPAKAEKILKDIASSSTHTYHNNAVELLKEKPFN